MNHSKEKKEKEKKDDEQLQSLKRNLIKKVKRKILMKNK